MHTNVISSSLCTEFVRSSFKAASWTGFCCASPHSAKACRQHTRSGVWMKRYSTWHHIHARFQKSADPYLMKHSIKADLLGDVILVLQPLLGHLCRLWRSCACHSLAAHVHTSNQDCCSYVHAQLAKKNDCRNIKQQQQSYLAQL